MIFAALAIVLIAIAGYVYLENEGDEQPTAAPPNPESVGRLELVNVEQALEAQGLDAEVVRASARSPQLSNPAQPISLGDETLYVFVYSSVPERVADSDGLEPESITLVALGTPIAGDGEPPHVVIRGNVIVVLPGGDPELREEVDAAMASLPDVGGTPEAAWNSQRAGSVAAS